jgi:hypothetical protein
MEFDELVLLIECIFVLRYENFVKAIDKKYKNIIDLFMDDAYYIEKLINTGQIESIRYILTLYPDILESIEILPIIQRNNVEIMTLLISYSTIDKIVSLFTDVVEECNVESIKFLIKCGVKPIILNWNIFNDAPHYIQSILIDGIFG